MEIHQFNYNFLKPKIDSYFSNKYVKLYSSSKCKTFNKFAEASYNHVIKIDLEHKSLLYKLYNELNAECEKYGIFLIIDLDKWSRMIEYLAFNRKNTMKYKKPFFELIEEVADLHFKCLREDKLRVTGWL